MELRDGPPSNWWYTADMRFHAHTKRVDDDHVQLFAMGEKVGKPCRSIDIDQYKQGHFAGQIWHEGRVYYPHVDGIQAERPGALEGFQVSENGKTHVYINQLFAPGKNGPDPEAPHSDVVVNHKVLFHNVLGPRVRISPDGKRLAVWFWRSAEAARRRELPYMYLDGKVISRATFTVTSFSPDSRHWVGLMRDKDHRHTLVFDGKAISSVSGRQPHMLGWDAKGRYVCTMMNGSSGWDTYLVGRGVQRVPGYLHMSSDGRHWAKVQSANGGQQLIYDGKPLLGGMRVEMDENPFIPNGQGIAYWVRVGRDRHRAAINKTVIAEATKFHEPIFSRDGSAVAFVGQVVEGKSIKQALYINRKRVAESDGFEVIRLSADGKSWAAVVGHDYGINKLGFVQPTHFTVLWNGKTVGEPFEKVLKPFDMMRDGRPVFLAMPQDGSPRFQLYLGGEVVKTGGSDVDTQVYAISPDGNHFAFASGTSVQLDGKTLDAQGVVMHMGFPTDEEPLTIVEPTDVDGTGRMTRGDAVLRRFPLNERAGDSSK